MREKKFTWKKKLKHYRSCATIVSMCSAKWRNEKETLKKAELTIAESKSKSNNNKHWKRGLGFGVNRIIFFVSFGSPSKQTNEQKHQYCLFYIESIYGNEKILPLIWHGPNWEWVYNLLLCFVEFSVSHFECT